MAATTATESEGPGITYIHLNTKLVLAAEQVSAAQGLAHIVFSLV